MAVTRKPSATNPHSTLPATTLSRAIRAALALSAVAGMGLASTAMAANFTVTNLADDGSTGSLRSAIVQANSATDTDTITFAPSLTGTITLSQALGSLRITEPLTITGPGASALTINGGALATLASTVTTHAVADVAPSGSVFLILNEAATPQVVAAGNAQTDATLAGGLPVTLSGMTITGGSGYSSSGSETYGGGIMSTGADLTLDHCTITGNSATAGGGIASKGNGSTATAGSLVITDSHIDGNQATIGGGLLSATPTLSISDSSISGNTANGVLGASGPSGGVGGGLLVGNKYGNGTISINRTTISNNSAATEAGGIAISMSDSAYTGTLSLNASTISGNSAGIGGGGLITGYLIGNVVNSTIANNVATGTSKYTGGSPPTTQPIPAIGGGLIVSLTTDSAALTPSSFNFVNSTIAGNQAVYGGGLFADSYGSSSTLSAINTVIGGNSASIGPDVIGPSVLAGVTGATGIPGNAGATTMPFVLQNSLVETDVAGMNADGITVTDNGGNRFGSAPMLGPLGNNGGPTPTMLALAGSPLIDAGVSNASTGPYDQRGVGFPRIVGSAIDMGATEAMAAAAPIASVSVPSLGDGGKWTLGGLLALAGLLLTRRRRSRA